MNRGALKTQASEFAGDPQMTRYTETQYNTAADRAQEQFALDTEALFKDMTPVTLSAGDAENDLPSDFIKEDFVTFDGTELIPISKHDLQRQYGKDWSTTEGTPSHVLINPEEAEKTILIWPIPQEAASLGMRYSALPAAMDDDADVPLNGSTLLAAYHIGLAAYTAWLVLGNETPTPEIRQKRMDLLAQYADSVGKAIDKFKNTASAPIKIPGNRFVGDVWS